MSDVEEPSTEAPAPEAPEHAAASQTEPGSSAEDAVGAPEEGTTPADEEEIERLRAENEALRTKVGEKRSRTRRVLTSIAIVLLVALTSLALNLGAIGMWMHQRVFNTDGWVETVAPLPENPDVQKVLTTRISNKIIEQADIPTKVSALLTEAQNQASFLPQQLPIQALAAPISSAIQSFITDAVAKIVASDQFQTAWVAANRFAQSRLVAVLSGQSTLVKLEGNTVYLDLGTVIEQVQQKLVDAGLGLAGKITLPSDFGQIQIMRSDQLSTVQGLFDRLNRWWWSMPLLALVLAAVALAIASDRRRVLWWIGAGTLIVGLAIVIGVRVTRNQITGGIQDTTTKNAVIYVWKAFLTPLWRVESILLVLALLLATVVAVTGPSAWAVKLRAVIARQFESWRAGAVVEKAPSGLTAFLRQRRRLTEGAAVALALLILLLLSEPTVLTVLLIAVVLLVVILAIEFLAGPPQRAVAVEETGQT